MTDLVVPRSGHGTADHSGAAPRRRGLFSIRTESPPVLVSLADGGVGGASTVKEAHRLVALHAPVETARLRELYIRAQYLLLPAAEKSCRQYIEDDILAAATILSTWQNADQRPEEAAVRAAKDILSDRVARADHCISENSETRALRYYSHGLTIAMIYTISVLATLILALYLGSGHISRNVGGRRPDLVLLGWPRLPRRVQRALGTPHHHPQSGQRPAGQPET